MLRFLQLFSKRHQQQMQKLFDEGKKHMEDKKWKEAVEKFDQILEAQPNQKGARVRRAQAEVELEKLNDQPSGPKNVL